MGNKKNRKTQKDNTNSNNIGPFYKRTEVLLSIIAIIIASVSAYYTYDANSHQEIIEESDLKIGGALYQKDHIAIPVLIGYYSRYPAIITSVTVFLNDVKIQSLDIPPQLNKKHILESDRIVDKNEPVFIKLTFVESEKSINESMFDLNSNNLFFYSHLLNDMNGEVMNRLKIEIHYHDFSKKATYAITPEIEITSYNGIITDANLDYIAPITLVKQLN